ncbi:hypothetical protein GWI33_003578 [Rhynchophorus ferrugineus]|uniref:Uncharacterized protein n=1 Tax=Rhynchophorus ferrugineus TaxID=354439 RepID=A0A834HIW5_RHYFE|nr:hypothetical protein GWI33_003578 [Rhynchophorus ferrugineus]
MVLKQNTQVGTASNTTRPITSIIRHPTTNTPSDRSPYIKPLLDLRFRLYIDRGRWRSSRSAAGGGVNHPPLSRTPTGSPPPNPLDAPRAAIILPQSFNPTFITTIVTGLNRKPAGYGSLFEINATVKIPKCQVSRGMNVVYNELCGYAQKLCWLEQK